MRCGFVAIFFGVATLSVTTLATEQDAGVQAKFDIGREGRLIILPVTVAGREYPFVFDTGTSRTVYDSSLASHLGRPRASTGIKEGGGSIIQMKQFSSTPVRLGRLNIQTDDLVLCWDLEPFRQETGQDIRGVLGMTVFKNRVVQIDFDAGRLVVLTPSLKPDPAWGEPVPMTYDPETGNPWVVATVMDKSTYSFLVDTGMMGTGSLSPSLFAHLYNQAHWRRQVNPHTWGPLDTSRREWDGSSPSRSGLFGTKGNAWAREETADLASTICLAIE